MSKLLWSVMDVQHPRSLSFCAADGFGTVIFTMYPHYHIAQEMSGLVPSVEVYYHLLIWTAFMKMGSAILAHFMLKERLQRMGVLGCVLCIVGSTVIVLHAPEERTPSSVEEIWDLATQPAFLLYTASAIAIALVLMLHFAPRYGETNIMIYLGICSIIGSLTVMSIKAVGIAIKLTIGGDNQAGYFQTWIFAMVAISCIVTQLNYLNKALDTFNTAVVSPIYYAMFTTFTILASAIMFKDLSGQSASNIASEICGLITVLSGTTVLHSTREPDPPPITEFYTPLSPKISWHIQGNGELWKHKDEDGLSADFVTVLQNDYFT